MRGYRTGNAFHVLAVHPWSRLLGTGRPEPLEVLDSCWIGWARVVAVEPKELLVRVSHLEHDNRRLTLGPERQERIGSSTGPPGSWGPRLARG